MKEIVKSFPPSSFLPDNQASVIEKFDEKYNLLDTFIKALKGLQKEKEKILKCTFSESLKYFYEFLEEYEENLKYPLKI